MDKEDLQPKQGENNDENNGEITISVGMKVRYMYAFMFQHIHRSIQGIFGVALSVVSLVLFFLSLREPRNETHLVIFLICGLLFTVVNPIIILIRAQQQVLLAPVYKQPLQYTFNEDGMTVAQGEQSQFLEWNKVVSVRAMSSILVIYTSRNAGSILAYKELGDKREQVEKMIAKGCIQAGVEKIPARLKRLV